MDVGIETEANKIKTILCELNFEEIGELERAS